MAGPEIGAGEPLAYTVADASRVTGLGKTTLYAERKAGRLRFVRVAGRTLVPAAELRRLIAEAPEAGEDRDNTRRERARQRWAKAAGKGCAA